MQKQNSKEILRWVDKIYPSEEEFFNVLNSKKLVIYHGVDPTGPQLHLGHSTNYLLLRKLQKMGHKIILVVNKIDKPHADPKKVVDQTLELFLELDATAEQIEFPIVYRFV